MVAVNSRRGHDQGIARAGHLGRMDVLFRIAAALRREYRGQVDMLVSAASIHRCRKPDSPWLRCPFAAPIAWCVDKSGIARRKLGIFRQQMETCFCGEMA